MFAESKSHLLCSIDPFENSLITDLLSTGKRRSTQYSVKNYFDSSTDDDDQTRNAKKILDYKMVMAAAVIQRAVRRWLAVRRFRLRRAAGIIGQKTWRGFSARRNYFYLYEEKVQAATLQRFSDAATMIQAAYRGWLSRRHNADLTALKRLQTDALIDLLSCMAFKFHHMIHSGSIPGIYSLRSSNCLEKVKNFLATLNIRYYNEFAERTFKIKRENIKNARMMFEESKLYTKLPYSGPNDFGNCEVPLPDMKEYFSYSARMRKLVEKYECSKGTDKAVQMLRKAKKAEEHKKEMERQESKIQTQNNFCSEVIDSMKRWQIWDTDNFEIADDLFNSPENVECFLDEVESVIRDFKYNCYCAKKNQPLGERCE